jgi:putative ABC transport system permease protein
VLGDAIRREVRRVDPDMPVYGLQPMTDVVNASMAPRRFAATLLWLFSAFALVLVCVGLYGVIAYLVTQRTREFGIRLALGAQRRDVLGIVLGYGTRVAAAGIVTGLAAAWPLTRGLQTLLYEVSPGDATTFVGVPLVLGAVAVVACYVPARRAMLINPTDALRRE